MPLPFSCGIINNFLSAFAPEVWQQTRTKQDPFEIYHDVAVWAGVSFPFADSRAADEVSQSDFCDAVESLMFCVINKCAELRNKERANA